MRTRPVDDIVQPRESVSGPLVLALCQVAMGTFAIAAAYFARNQIGPLNALAVGIGGAVLAVSALRAFDPSPPLSWYLQFGGGRFSWLRKLTAPPVLALAFVSVAPVSVAAIVDRYWPGVPLGALAAASLLATFGAIAAVRLRCIANGRVAPRVDEWEGAFALGAVSLGVVLLLAWLLARFDQALIPGLLPGSLSAESVAFLSYASTLAAGLAAALLLFLPRLVGRPPARVLRVAMTVLCAPLVLVLLVPMQAHEGFGQAAVLGYADLLSSRVFLTTIVTLGLVHLIAPPQTGLVTGTAQRRGSTTGS